MVGVTTKTSELPNIHCNNITAGYEPTKPVFSGLSISLQAAQLVHVVGENGSGKSTLVELLSGYLRPVKGTVLVNGIAASDDRARQQRRICRTTVSLFPSMTVHDHLVFTARRRQVQTQHALGRGAWHGLEQCFDEVADNLSTGNQRKLWYVINTIGDFNIIVLDEPFNGLDKESIQKVCAELTQWAERKLVVLVAHQLPENITPTRAVGLQALKASNTASS